MGQRLKFWLSLWSLLLKAVAAQAKKHCLLPGKKGDPSTEGEEGDGGGCISTNWMLLIYQPVGM